jgi:hypothetical protein
MSLRTGRSAYPGERQSPVKCHHRKPTIVAHAATVETVDRAVMVVIEVPGEMAIEIAALVTRVIATALPAMKMTGTAARAPKVIEARAHGWRVIESEVRGPKPIATKAHGGIAIVAKAATADDPAGRT